MRNIQHPRFIAAMRTSIKEAPVDFDSETAIARHITYHAGQVAAQLGMSDTGIISTDGSLWQYSTLTGTWSRIEIDDMITLAQLFDGALPGSGSGGDSKPRRIRTGHQRSVNIAKSALRLHEVQAHEFFASPRRGIACTSGFVEVTGEGVEQYEHDSGNRATVAYDFDLDTESPPPEKWIGFLDTLWAGDADRDAKIAVLQEFVGASIANLATQYQKCLLLLGAGSNGKSVLCELIAELLFPEGTATFISPRRWDRDYSVAGLGGASINIVSELPETSALESADVFKAIISGDKLEARLPYQPPHFIRPSAGHMFSANEIPRTSDTSHGFFRRFITMQFNHNFDESPTRRTKAEILADIEEERAAIIVWALRGASRLIERGGYTEIASHKETMTSWQNESDVVCDFAHTCLEIGDGGSTTFSDLFKEHEEFALQSRRVPVSKITMGKRLRNIKGLTSKKTAAGKTYNCSIRLISERDQYAH